MKDIAPLRMARSVRCKGWIEEGSLGGYAGPQARRSMEFGLLKQDALRVLDEVQLSEVGVASMHATMDK